MSVCLYIDIYDFESLEASHYSQGIIIASVRFSTVVRIYLWGIMQVCREKNEDNQIMFEMF